MMKKAIVMCTCSFACPSMKDINFPELTERIRMELPHDFLVLHPRLCEENGENMMADLLKQDVYYFTPACGEEKQAKLLRDGFERANVPMTNWKPIAINFKTTDQVFEDVKRALEEVA